jgi:hypothetical protein
MLVTSKKKELWKLKKIKYLKGEQYNVESSKFCLITSMKKLYNVKSLYVIN